MASNPIADPGMWQSGGLTPPAEWNGSAYEFLSFPSNSPSVYLFYTGPATTGSFDFVATQHSGDAIEIQVSVDFVPQSYPLEIGVPRTITVPAGTDISIVIHDDKGALPYAMDVTIAPTGANAFWTDLVGCIEV